MLISELCTEASMRSPRFMEWAERMRPAWDGDGSGRPLLLHRKLWEWLYIAAALEERGVLREGSRGLGFGVGQEPLTALFASTGCEIVATDLDVGSADQAGWVDTNQHAAQLDDLNDKGLCPPEVFARSVSFRTVDMNDIPSDLRDFDFTWSSCAFEHLGSIARGQAFVLEQMRCLRPGGVGVHTTELNVSSPRRTIDFAHTVLFRQRDIDALTRAVRASGDHVEVSFDAGTSEADRHVDHPPYTDVHLKVAYQGFTTTSLGLIVEKGDADATRRGPAAAMARTRLGAANTGRRNAKRARRVAGGVKRRTRRAASALRRRNPVRRASDARFVRRAYRDVLRREADANGLNTALDHLATGSRTREGTLDDLISSDEFRTSIHYLNPIVSMHVSRCRFVQSLPRAARILDLGGASQNDPDGALIALTYPYEFDELVIVDLPFDERHELYGHGSPIEEVQTRLGMVRYRYHSMADFSGFDDDSFDMVYSGQTIEHVEPEECDMILQGVRRVLRPGGFFAVDTPNGPVCRLQQEAFINPDHKVEYSHGEFSERLERAGLDIVGAWGLNWLGESVRTGQFLEHELRENVGLYHEIEECYLLAYLCRKPA
jgi:SAM-dependent methyltransferase